MNKNENEKTTGHDASIRSGTKRKVFGEPKFPLGQLVVTTEVEETLTPREVFGALHRHRRGDWGMVCQEDWRENNASLKLGCRLLSAYETETGVKFWIITESDRSVTTVLFPHQY